MTDMYARIRTSVGGGLIFFGLYALLPSFFVCLLFSISCYMLMIEWPRVRGGDSPWYVIASIWDFNFMYPLVPLCLLIMHVVQWRAEAPWYGLYPFLAAWLVDAIAYFAGLRWGRHLCWPTISPRKTWEGVAGGILALVVAHSLLWAFRLVNYPLWYMLVSGVVVAVISMLGDLIMSWYKRQQGLKDTGGILPGHGGLLDRFDSVLAVVILVKVVECCSN